MIIRNDDVSANTNFYELDKMYGLIRGILPEAEIWSCVNLFAKTADGSKLYPDLPLKQRPLSYFYGVDKIWSPPLMDLGKLVSHGLLHFDHTKPKYEVKKMSILTSCRALKTDIFVPPFNRYDAQMELICQSNGIEMVTHEEDWKSLEHNRFDKNHELWYFHSWRYDLEKLRETLCDGLLAQVAVDYTITRH